MADVRIAGVERLTLDFFVDEWPQPFAYDGEVVFTDVPELEAPARVGGTIGNGLVALAQHRMLSGADATLVWQGFASTDRPARRAARLLRDEGVEFAPVGRISQLTRTACVIEAGDVRGIVVDVDPGPAIVDRTVSECDMVIVGLDSLDHVAEALQGRRVFVCVNHVPEAISPAAAELLAGAAGLSGRREEVEALLALGVELRAPLAITLGAEGALVREDGRERRLAPPGVPARRLLGAGDAFAAGFALGLAQGGDAGAVATAVCGAWIADEATERDVRLAERLAEHGAKTYVGGDRERVRALTEQLCSGPDVVMLSGGQTGVDTIATEEALAAGLPAINIMPRGRRREDDGAAEGRIVELESPSYGDRTAAGVDASDIFVSAGDVKTDGSRAAAGFARAFGRRRLVLADDVAERILDAGGGVVGIGGPRGSNLSDDEAATIRLGLRRMLRTLALGRVPWPDEDGRPPQRAAVPESGPAAVIARALLRGCELHPARPRDMPRLLDEGLVDAAVGGLDDFVEGGLDRDAVRVHPTGILQSSIVLVGEGERLVSQIPLIAGALTGADVTPIHGAAETWVRLGAYSAVDTLHTGASAEDLPVRAVLGTTALTLISARDVRIPREWALAWRDER